LLAVLMDFCSGSPMQFLSGVDSLLGRVSPRARFTSGGSPRRPDLAMRALARLEQLTERFQKVRMGRAFLDPGNRSHS
jgi:hypothetical protein